MVMPPSGRFDYVAVVPERVSANGFECQAALREPIVSKGHDLWDSRLVGHSPTLRVVDAGLTPDPGIERPRVMRSMISLIAAERRYATVASASFHVDKALISCLRAGDVVHLARTGCACLGLSILREGALVVAAGAIAAVPLGNDIAVRTPGDLIRRAEAVFQEHDNEFEFSETPVEVQIGASRALILAGHRSLGAYGVSVMHGFQRGLPGRDECATICQTRACPETAAQASAMLLDLPDALSLSRQP